MDVEVIFINDDGKLILCFNEGDYIVLLNMNIVFDGIQYYVFVEYIYYELQYCLFLDKEGIFFFEFFLVYIIYYLNGELSDEFYNNDLVKQIMVILVDNVFEVVLNNDSEIILFLLVLGILFFFFDDVIIVYNRGVDIFSFLFQGSGEIQLECVGFIWII